MQLFISNPYIILILELFLFNSGVLTPNESGHWKIPSPPVFVRLWNLFSQAASLSLYGLDLRSTDNIQRYELDYIYAKGQ